ncbi:hypothetical protein P9436_05250 [Lysinibacillus capsici]|uniref:hypothetical protein n=1 Tax=Lysinibacillus capsici TaxID=2115968 RepID=UPI00029C9BE5|nr:hypothetical protein [Lysinibacillus capsici]EKU41278.1 hypothetical protein C518_3772 [Lysinibacillus fusiformis ZB2]MED4698452.1 hypothetical protein [Lysinibacillus capsici]
MNYEILFSEPAQKITIAIVTAVITLTLNILYQNRKSKKEDKKKKYESFYQEVVHDIDNLFKTMNAFRTDYLTANPYEQKDKLMQFIEDNKKLLEEKSFNVNQELKEVQLFEDFSGNTQDILEVKLFAEILDDYEKLYKPKDESYKILCLIQIWRITLLLNNINYTVCGAVLKYTYQFNENLMDKKLYKSLLKITTTEQHDEFKKTLSLLISPNSDSEIIDNIINVPEGYHYYEDSMAIGKMHLLEFYEQEKSLSIEEKQTYRYLILQYLYSIHHGNETHYDNHFNKTEDMNINLKNALSYLCDKTFVGFDIENNCYKITAKGIDEYEKHELKTIQ